MATSRSIVAAAVLGLSAAAARGDLIYVDDDNCPGPGSGTPRDPFCSIQAAIDAALDGDEVVVAPGTYLEAIDFAGRSITVRSSDGRAVTTIDATGLGASAVRMASQEVAVLQGFTVTGGTGDDSSGPVRGGGLYVYSNASVAVLDCTFTGNSAEQGGGVFVYLAELSMSGCTVGGNSADEGGGAWLWPPSGTVGSVADCTFTGNQASQGGGGTWFHSGEATFTACTFEGNTASGPGGGMAVQAGQPCLEGCAFAANTAGLGGGLCGVSAISGLPKLTGCTITGCAAVVGGGAFLRNSLEMTDCQIEANTAYQGGGVYNDGGTLHLTGSMLTANDAVFEGGAAYSTTAEVFVTDCGFTLNTADVGGALYAVLSHLEVAGTTFDENSTTFAGGAIYSASSSGSVVGSTFSGNETREGGGGAMSNDGSSPDIARCSFIGNAASGAFHVSRGGAISTIGGDPTVTSSVFTGNSAGCCFGAKGAAIYSEDSSPLITNCTFSGNFLPTISGAGTGETLISNCIVWGKQETIFNEDQSVTTVRYSLVDGGFAGPGNLDLDPLFQGEPMEVVFPDIDGDGIVTVADLVQVLFDWGECDACCLADLNLDGVVDVTDLVILLTSWG